MTLVAPCSPRITLAIAEVEERTGAFAAIEDALYYIANSSQPSLPADILDCTKLQALWERRRTRLQDKGLACLVAEVESGSDVITVAATEYILHEVGHRLGFSLFNKQRTGFFRLSGKLSWPLVFFEEHRADLCALAGARQLLEPAMRRRVVAYHLAHRMGLALESCETNRPPAGLVPLLLVSVLLEHRLVSITSTPARAGMWNNIASLEDIEDALSRHASLIAETDTRLLQDPVALAMGHARYVRQRLEDARVIDDYNLLVS